MSLANDTNGNYLHEDASCSWKRMSENVTNGQFLTTIELKLAYMSEKLLNLEMLFMQIENICSDYESIVVVNGDFPEEYVKKAFQFDMLTGILSLEVKELDHFIASLQLEVIDVHHRLSPCPSEIKEKLRDVEASLQQSQDRIADMKEQSAKIESFLAKNMSNVDKEIENGHFSPTEMESMGKLRTVEQKRNILLLLENSLARELDLEKKLSDSRDREDELRVKLEYSSQAYNMEESVDIIMERLFRGENASEILLGLSKELLGKLQILQFNLNSSVKREYEIKSKLEESILKLSEERSFPEKLKESSLELAEYLIHQVDIFKSNLGETKNKCMLASSEAAKEREKMNSLEEKPRCVETELQLVRASAGARESGQSMLHSESTEKDHFIQNLRDAIFQAENRAESAEAKCDRLIKTNNELNKEVSLLKNSGTDKASDLERKLKESDTQLEHAKASYEAMEEQKNMLYSTLNDMGNLIEDLKGKVSKAESRAENAESRCSLLTETNLELNEEISFLRTRIESLETSLHQADDAKRDAAKDIGIRTKLIADLVSKLTLGREHLQLEISALRKKNKALTSSQCWRVTNKAPPSLTDNVTCSLDNHSLTMSTEASTEFSGTNFQVENSAAPPAVHETALESTSESQAANETLPEANSSESLAFDETSRTTRDATSAEHTTGEESRLDMVRTIEAKQIGTKLFFLSILVVCAALLTAHLLQQEISL